MTVRGGISRLIEKVKDACPKHIEFHVIATCSEYIGDGRLWTWCVQPVVFLRSVIQVLVVAVSRRSTIFHVHFSERGSTLRKGIICVILRALRCRYVVQGHACQDALFHEWVPAFVRRILLWGICGARYVIALTRFWRDYYAEKLKISPDKLLVLPNPANIPLSIPDRTVRSGLRLLFLGRVGERKGAFDLIRAFAALPNAVRQECHLTLAGDGETAIASDLLAQLGCSGQASVLGWVGGQDVDRLLAEADVLLLPSRGEGMAFAVLEGMAWGLAVVTSSVGGADEFLEAGRNCIVVDPGDVPGISRAIIDLACNPELRLRLGAGARNSAGRFSIDRYMAALTRLYEDLAEGSSTSEPISAPELEKPLHHG